MSGLQVGSSTVDTPPSAATAGATHGTPRTCHTTSSSSAPAAPARQRPACWPSAATTSSSWTVPSSRATPCPPTASPAAASSSSPGGAPRRRAGVRGSRRARGHLRHRGPGVTAPLKDRAGVDLLVAPRRMVLDTILADAAIAGGAVVRTCTAVTGLLRDATGRVAGVGARTRDGRDLTLRARTSSARTGCVRRWPRSSAPDHQRSRRRLDLLHLRRPGAVARLRVPRRARAFAGVFPTHDGQACVWLSRRRPCSAGYAAPARGGPTR